MAGIRVKISIQGGGAVAEQLKTLSAADPSYFTPALKNIGIGMVQSTRRRFVDERSPSGKPWEPLLAEYAATKKGTKILSESGRLRDSLTMDVSGGVLSIGSNVIYAAIHQRGGEIRPKAAPALVFRLGSRVVKAAQVEIPARPYLGLSAEDRTEIIEIVQDFLDQALAGSSQK